MKFFFFLLLLLLNFSCSKTVIEKSRDPKSVDEDKFLIKKLNRVLLPLGRREYWKNEEYQKIGSQIIEIEKKYYPAELKKVIQKIYDSGNIPLFRGVKGHFKSNYFLRDVPLGKLKDMHHYTDGVSRYFYSTSVSLGHAMTYGVAKILRSKGFNQNLTILVISWNKNYDPQFIERRGDALEVVLNIKQGHNIIQKFEISGSEIYNYYKDKSEIYTKRYMDFNSSWSENLSLIPNIKVQEKRPRETLIGILGDLYTGSEWEENVDFIKLFEQLKNKEITHLIILSSSTKDMKSESLKKMLLKVSSGTGIQKENIFLYLGKRNHQISSSALEDLESSFEKYSNLVFDSKDDYGIIKINNEKIMVSDFPQFPIPENFLHPIQGLRKNENQTDYMHKMPKNISIPSDIIFSIYVNSYVSGFFLECNSEKYVINLGVLDNMGSSSNDLPSYAIYEPGRKIIYFLDYEENSFLTALNISDEFRDKKRKQNKERIKECLLKKHKK